MKKLPDNHANENEIWTGTCSINTYYVHLILLGLLALMTLIGICLIPALRGSGLVWIVFFAVLFAFVLVFAGIYLFNRLNRWYVLTNERMIHREGILVRRHHVLELIRIDDVTYEQGPVEAFLGCGTILIESSDTSHPVLTMYGIGEVQKIANLIDSCRREERKERGLHIEHI